MESLEFEVCVGILNVVMLQYLGLRNLIVNRVIQKNQDMIYLTHLGQFLNLM